MKEKRIIGNFVYLVGRYPTVMAQIYLERTTIDVVENCHFQGFLTQIVLS